MMKLSDSWEGTGSQAALDEASAIIDKHEANATAAEDTAGRLRNMEASVVKTKNAVNKNAEDVQRDCEKLNNTNLRGEVRATRIADRIASGRCREHRRRVRQHRGTVGQPGCPARHARRRWQDARRPTAGSPRPPRASQRIPANGRRQHPLQTSLAAAVACSPGGRTTKRQHRRSDIHNPRTASRRPRRHRKAACADSNRRSTRPRRLQPRGQPAAGVLGWPRLRQPRRLGQASAAAGLQVRRA